jgi:hypothetical protein
LVRDGSSLNSFVQPLRILFGMKPFVSLALVAVLLKVGYVQVTSSSPESRPNSVRRSKTPVLTAINVEEKRS